MSIIWFSQKVKGNYELKPEDYDFYDYGFYTQGGVVRVYHKSGQYVGYIPNTEEVTP